MAAESLSHAKDRTLTHRDLAVLLGVSETTIKSYRRKFPEFFPVHSRGKPLRFREEAGAVCRLIRQCFQEDLSVAETRARLAAEFKVLPARERLDPAANRSPAARGLDSAAGVAPAAEGLRPVLDRLVELQAKANERLDTLQELLADFLTLHVSREDSFSHGLDELRQAWTTQTATLERLFGAVGAASGQERRILVRNAYGVTSEYVFRAEGQDLHNRNHEQAPVSAPGVPPLEEEAAPPEELLTLPLVVSAGQGEYLGVAGRSAGPFSLADLLGLMDLKYPAPHDFSVTWKRTPEGWQVWAEQAGVIRPRRMCLLVQRTRTPRGNLVAVLAGMEENGVDQPPANLFGFIKKMKEGRED